MIAHSTCVWDFFFFFFGSMVKVDYEDSSREGMGLYAYITQPESLGGLVHDIQ